MRVKTSYSANLGDRIAVLTASITIVKFDAHGPLLEVLGDRYHIPKNIRDLAGT